jgi:hypothetical protein
MGYARCNGLGRMIAFVLRGPTIIRATWLAFAASGIPIERRVKLKSFSQHEIAEKVVKVVIVGFVLERE